MSDLEEMRNFVRVVEAGSISRAAEQMGVAKSGVSRRLQDLEERLGVRLINRTTRRSSLTDAGQVYYEGAGKLVGDVAELDARVSVSDASLTGRLKLAAPLSFGLCHLGPAIDEFLRLHPGVLMDIEFSDRQVDLVEQGIDLAIRIAELQDSSLYARRLFPVRLRLCAGPAYLERHGEPREPAELAGHRMLHYQPGAGSQLRLLDAAGREHRVQTRPGLVADNGDFLRDMAVAGHGVVVLPTFIAWQALASGALLPVLPEYRLAPLEAWAIYPQRRYLSQRARALVDFLADRFGEEPYWDRPPAEGL